MSNLPNMPKRHTLSIRDPIYEQLKNKGKFGESFSDLLSRLLNESSERDGGNLAAGRVKANQVPRLQKVNKTRLTSDFHACHQASQGLHSNSSGVVYGSRYNTYTGY